MFVSIASFLDVSKMTLKIFKGQISWLIQFCNFSATGNPSPWRNILVTGIIKSYHSLFHSFSENCKRRVLRSLNQSKFKRPERTVTLTKRYDKSMKKAENSRCSICKLKYSRLNCSILMSQKLKKFVKIRIGDTCWAWKQIVGIKFDVFLNLKNLNSKLSPKSFEKPDSWKVLAHHATVKEMESTRMEKP